MTSLANSKLYQNSGDEIQGLPGITGAAIMGDGKASLILDLQELTQRSQPKADVNRSRTNQAEKKAIVLEEGL